MNDAQTTRSSTLTNLITIHTVVTALLTVGRSHLQIQR
ncbi:Uncharacterised protein [Mycobacteroides abscessus subsp. bolletii]|nr:Uncharacterised protein [Mycobacteroides abscessus subsp. bolletii]SHW20354.1 Uncharacterised protein [Mycobacteroides abscessus subsp. bolletii]SKS67440.1 Uncharacterised protein [Mycobacteroides abscessus subsp. bolletii]SKS68407.1 Uncharacterised protein [Mycobacteroides abscessus subsp. bolletii]SKW25142.1 Uncharacterised protein [Mycobacteroides abscessus subsp. bolletii]